MIGFTYILLCSDGSYYTGSTDKLETRMNQHHAGEGSDYTRARLPVNLVFFEQFQTVNEAFIREHQIKKWSRVKKEALIRSEQNQLPRLSRNYTQYGKPGDE